MNETTYQVLLTLRSGDRPAPDMLDGLRAIAGEAGTPSLAAFYRMLKNGIDRGWLEVVGNDATGPGRPRQIYHLTPFGQRALEKEARRLRSLAALGLGDAVAD